MKNKMFGSKKLSLILNAAVALVALGCGMRDPHFKILAKSQSLLAAGYNNKVDILWVIDNSGTMGPKQTNLANSINSFMNQFVTYELDYQIAVVTTDIRAIDPAHPNDPNFSGQDSCIVGSPQIITPTTPNPAGALATNANVGFFGSADAHGLDAARLALSDPRGTTGCNTNFLRPDAFLAVIFFSDADDNTTGTVDQLLAQLDSVKGTFTIPGGATIRPYFASAMVVEDVARAECVALGPFSEKGVKFMDAATRTNGTIASICDADFSAGLLAIGTKILETSTAIQLLQIPDTSTIVIRQSGDLVPNDALNGWTYDSSTNRVVFHGISIPKGANVLITVDYTPKDIVR